MLLAMVAVTPRNPERRPQSTDIGVELRLFNPPDGARQVLHPNQASGFTERGGPQLNMRAISAGAAGTIRLLRRLRLCSGQVGRGRE
jgi:hypothetical protein